MYQIVYGLFYLLSLIPMRVMHGISSFVTWVVCDIIGYRKEVVMKNLAIAFPEKSEAERKIIAREFYRNFCDSMLESIKLLSMSDREIASRFTGDISLLYDIMDRTGRNIQLHALHNFNWEIVHLGLVQRFKYPFVGVYGPIKNKLFERLFKHIRNRFGTILIPAPEFRNNSKKYLVDRYLLALVADQSPAVPATAWWTDFFGRPTAFVTGPEKGARSMDTTVIFGTFFKVRRGYYSFEFHLATEDPRSLKEGELTLKYVRYVEECIRKRPDNYLWSHRRWKHVYKPEYEERWLDRSGD